MKVALLFFGQPRFITNPFPESSHKEFIINRYNTDVFCHIWWAKEQSDYDFSSWAKIQKCSVPKDPLGIIQNAYSPKELDFEPSRTFTLSKEDEEYMNLNFKDMDWTHWGQKKNISNVLSQLKSIENVINIFENKTNKEDYDFVVLSRLDNHIIQFPDLNSLEKNKFYVSDQHDNFPDLIYIFSPKFCSVFKVYGQVSKLLRSKTVWEPSAENFKFASYKNLFPYSDLIKIKMIAHPVRSDKEKGGIW